MHLNKDLCDTIKLSLKTAVALSFPHKIKLKASFDTLVNSMVLIIQI